MARSCPNVPPLLLPGRMKTHEDHRVHTYSLTPCNITRQSGVITRREGRRVYSREHGDKIQRSTSSVGRWEIHTEEHIDGPGIASGWFPNVEAVANT